MKRSVAVETEENDISTKTESILAHTPRRMSDPKIETSSSKAVMCEDVECQIRAVTDPLSQQLALFCELMKELRLYTDKNAVNAAIFPVNAVNAFIPTKNGVNAAIFPVKRR